MSDISTATYGMREAGKEEGKALIHLTSTPMTSALQLERAVEIVLDRLATSRNPHSNVPSTAKRGRVGPNRQLY